MPTAPRVLFVAALSALAAQGCIYAHVTAPLSYRSPTPSDVGGALGELAEGSACSHLVLYLVAWGDGGYAAAMADARQRSGSALLADVQVDSELRNYVSVYQRRCTRVRGRVVLGAAPDAAIAPAPSAAVAPASTP